MGRTGRIRLVPAPEAEISREGGCVMRFGGNLVGGLRLGRSLLPILICACALAGCGPLLKNATPMSEVRQDDQLRASGLYLIARGDEVDIVHVIDTDYNAVVTVKPDGNISVPGIPVEVQAAGRTTKDVVMELADLYRKYAFIKQPNFSLIVRNFASQQIFIGGEVQHPGYLELPSGDRTVFQVLMAAGGMLPTARTNEVIIVRNSVAGKPMTFSVNIDKIISGEDPSQNVIVHPLDTIFVPRTDIVDADIWVDQHIRQLIPVPGSVSASYSYNAGMTHP
jgi:protein involved in polysaccharide export with SLBB domain